MTRHSILQRKMRYWPIAAITATLVLVVSCGRDPTNNGSTSSERAKHRDGPAPSALGEDAPAPLCDTPSAKAVAEKLPNERYFLFKMGHLRRFKRYLHESFGIEEMPEGTGTFFAVRQTIEHQWENEHEFPRVYFAVPPEEIDGLFAYLSDRAVAACQDGRWRSFNSDQELPRAIKGGGDIEWNAGSLLISLHDSRAPSGERRDDWAKWKLDPVTGWVQYSYIDWDDDE